MQDQARPYARTEMEVGQITPPLAVELSEIISCFWEKGIQFSLRCSPEKANHSPVEGHTSKNICIASIGLVRKKKSGGYGSRGGSGKIWEKESECDQNS